MRSSGRGDTCRGIGIATMADMDVRHFYEASSGYSLKILVQPNPFYRLRYLTEMRGSHGALKGENAPLPKVQLELPYRMDEETETEIFIRVFVVFTASDEPHVHKIFTKESGTNDWKLMNHADITVSSQNDFQAEFNNLIIIRRRKSEWIEEEVTRQRNECGTDFPNSVEEFKSRAEQAWERLELHRFRLCFYAYKRGCPDLPLCGPLFSEVVSNQVDAAVGELKIVDMSAPSGKSGDRLFLLVSKIAKNSVKVRFFEGDPNKPSWEEYAKIIDLHHQVALIVIVPPYKEDIQIKVEVQVQLERTKSDGSRKRSETRSFSYRPSTVVVLGKRRLSTPLNSSSLVNERRSRTTGGCFSEENIHVQRGGQQLNPVQSCPNVNWPNQGSNLGSSLDEGSSLSQNLHQQLEDTHLMDGEEMASSVDTNNQQHSMQWTSGDLIQSSVLANSFQPNTQQYSGLQMADEALPQPSGIEGVFKCELIASLLGPHWEDPHFEADLATDSTDEKMKKTGKETLNVVTDGVGENTASGSTSLERNKDMRCTSTAKEQAIPSLFHVAMTGDARKLEELFNCMTKTEKRRLINEKNELEQTPLIIAVEQNFNECVELLCSVGANVNLTDEEENTPFHIAAKKNYNKCLETLLKVENRELNRKNVKGEAALHLAVQYNSVESVKLLIGAGANVNEKNCTAGLTPLHLAVLFGYTELVCYLLGQKTLNVHEENYKDKTAAALVNADQEDIISLFKELKGITVVVEEETDEDE